MAAPFFSIVMASHLDEYEYRNIKSATNRVEKFHRAVESVLAQSDPDWELVIVADGCLKTIEGCKERYLGMNIDLKVVFIPKQDIWSPVVRNEGLMRASGTWIIYLDTDDWLGPGHLHVLREHLSRTAEKWAHFDDLVLEQRSGKWGYRFCNLNKKHSFGTSNVAHSALIEARWPTGGYEHDFHFINTLKMHGPGQRIENAEYFVGHVPRRYDV